MRGTESRKLGREARFRARRAEDTYEDERTASSQAQSNSARTAGTAVQGAASTASGGAMMWATSRVQVRSPGAAESCSGRRRRPAQQCSVRHCACRPALSIPEPHLQSLPSVQPSTQPQQHHRPPRPNTTPTMSSIIGRAAFRATRPLYRPAGVSSGQGADSKPSTDALRAGAKRDPELYVRPPCSPMEVSG